MKRAETCSCSLCNKLYIPIPPYSCVRQYTNSNLVYYKHNGDDEYYVHKLEVFRSWDLRWFFRGVVISFRSFVGLLTTLDIGLECSYETLLSTCKNGRCDISLFKISSFTNCQWSWSNNACIAGRDKQNFSVTTATFFINFLPGLYLHNRGGHNAARTNRSISDIHVADAHEAHTQRHFKVFSKERRVVSNIN